MKYSKIAVIGSPDSVLIFKAVGVDVYGVTDAADAQKTLLSIPPDTYAVIFITDDFAAGMKPLLQKYKNATYPVVLPIPSAFGSTGMGLQGVYEDADKVLNSELLFNIK